MKPITIITVTAVITALVLTSTTTIGMPIPFTGIKDATSGNEPDLYSVLNQVAPDTIGVIPITSTAERGVEGLTILKILSGTVPGGKSPLPCSPPIGAAVPCRQITLGRKSSMISTHQMGETFSIPLPASIRPARRRLSNSPGH